MDVPCLRAVAQMEVYCRLATSYLEACLGSGTAEESK